MDIGISFSKIPGVHGDSSPPMNKSEIQSE